MTLERCTCDEVGRKIAAALQRNTTLTALEVRASDHCTNDFSQESWIKIEDAKRRNLLGAADQKALKAKQDKERKEKAAKKTAPLSPTQPVLGAPAKALQQPSIVLDAAVVKQLNAFGPNGLQALLEVLTKLSTVDWDALRTLSGKATQLEHLFEGEMKAENADSERKRIHADPDLETYHRYLVRDLIGTWLACLSITSGLVENIKKCGIDLFAQGLNSVGKNVPIIGSITSLISGAAKAWTDRQRRQDVQKIAGLFSEPEIAFKELSALARQVTLAQESAIKQIPGQSVGLVAGMRQRLQKVAATISGSDVDTPLKNKAIDDCDKILAAVRDGRITPSSTIPDILPVIMGSGYVLTPSPTPVSPSVSASTPMTPQSPTSSPAPSSPSISRPKENDETDEKARLVAQLDIGFIKQLLESQGHETVVPGGSEAQTQLNRASPLSGQKAAVDHAQADATATREQLARVTAELALMQARMRESEDKADATAARVGKLEHKGTRKDGCSVS